MADAPTLESAEADRRNEERRNQERRMLPDRTHLKMEQLLRRVNAEVMKKLVPGLNVESLEPFFRLVAEARGTYIKSVLAVTGRVEGLPTDEQVRELALLRRTYDELIHGAHALEAIIARGYIDMEK